MQRSTLFSVLFLTSVILASCGRSEPNPASTKEDTPGEVPVMKVNAVEPHPYGGWYCPDNLFGFPPMDIQDMGQLAVISDRLPTEEETQNGSSLILIDTEKHPNARPLDIDLPRVARMQSRYTQMEELVIVIQALVIGSDTIVGYRYPQGGNGSARMAEVQLLSAEALKAIGPSAMIHITETFTASKEAVWKSFTQTDYAKVLGERFGERAFFQADWADNVSLPLYYEKEERRAQGIVGNVWGNIYLQIDYEEEGQLYTEKLMVSRNADTDETTLMFVAGPFKEGLEMERAGWERFVADVTANLTNGKGSK